MTNLFENIQPKNILKLKQFLRSNTIKYPKNVNILSNVKRDDFIALIDYGTIVFEYNDYNGNTTILEELEQGELFGDLTIPLNSEDISCITKEETQITFIEYNRITNDEIIKTDFYIIFIKNLIKLLSEQVKIKNDRIEILTKRTIRDKILEYFKQTIQKKGHTSFTLPMTFTELASYLSVDRSAMSREISYLKEEGFIQTNGRRITLLYDPNR